MCAIPIHHRCPRAGIDPVDDAPTALAIVGLAMHRPRRAETIVVLLDAEQRGLGEQPDVGPGSRHKTCS